MSSNIDQIDESPAELRAILHIMWRAKWLILGIALVSGLASLLYALYAPRIYRAEALVQIRQDSPGHGTLNALSTQLAGLTDLVGFSGNAGADRALAIATLRSRLVLQAFIKDNNLLPVLFEDLWNAETSDWKDSDEDNPSLWHGYKKVVDELLQINEDRKTGLVTIAIEWHDPIAAASWISDLIGRTNAHLRAATIQESSNNLKYLREQGQRNGPMELQRAAYALEESELKTLMLAKGTEEFALKIVDPPQPPKMHVRPRPKLIVLLGILVGGALGVALALALNARWPSTISQSLPQARP